MSHCAAFWVKPGVPNAAGSRSASKRSIGGKAGGDLVAHGVDETGQVKISKRWTLLLFCINLGCNFLKVQIRMPLAHCQNCGHTFFSVIAMPYSVEDEANVVFKGNAERCPKCGGVAEAQNFALKGNKVIPEPGNSPAASRAFVEFQRKALQQLVDVQVSRPQLRRFERAALKKDIDEVLRAASEIDHKLEAIVQEGLESSDPNQAVSWIAKVLKLLRQRPEIIPLIVAGALSTANDALDLVEKWGDEDHKIHEIIERLGNPAPSTQLDEPKATPNEDPEKKFPPQRSCRYLALPCIISRRFRKPRRLGLIGHFPQRAWPAAQSTKPLSRLK
ncbi:MULTISPECIES: hypothetical protein [unclassified Ruegeria]|uniref:hypothetical protein n=1 Tax=unclassified Ruegeria TaxID=2625375 RepID=UPI00148854E5|nr:MULTISPECIES: hypothetical protein [unclassified Ruegeria]